MSILLAVTAAGLAAVGTYLILQRKLSRIIIGLGLLSHAGNVLLLSGGRPGIEPLIGLADDREMSDPLPQALALTAIVITFGVTAFLLAMAFRSWQLTHDDEVENDATDVLVAAGVIKSKDVLDEQLAEVEIEQEEAALEAVHGEVDE
ncbi:MAG TPA: NADH-quinone oxidoreductase subunit K [Ilumatobacteraceae bacterium]|nr:NADH-quinone oxidoreductase subunit K [Ilumatobacteraceae bacterium]